MLGTELCCHAVEVDEPVSYLTLEAGTEVRGSDGERVGVVREVLRDVAVDIFEGIVIDTSFGPGGHRFVDATHIAELRPDAVALAIPSGEIERLPKSQRG